MKVNSGQAPSTLIPEYIGSDFDKVVTVADNMEAVTEVVNNLDHIKFIEENITDVSNVGANIEDVVNVSTNMDYVKDVSQGIEGLPVVSYIGAEPPTQPLEGAEWFCTLDGRTYTWYKDNDSAQWVESSPQSTNEVDPTILHKVTKNTDNIFVLWKRSIAEAGFNLVDGSFEEGGILTSPSDALWHKESESVYLWTGVFPSQGYVVVPGSTPILVDGWDKLGEVTLRSEVVFKSDYIKRMSYTRKQFSTVVDMINNVSALQLGDIVHCETFYTGVPLPSPNKYVITTDAPDGMFVIDLGNGLSATLQYNKTQLFIERIGAKPDLFSDELTGAINPSRADNLPVFNAAKAKGCTILAFGAYYLSSKLDLGNSSTEKRAKIIGDRCRNFDGFGSTLGFDHNGDGIEFFAGAEASNLLLYKFGVNSKTGVGLLSNNTHAADISNITCRGWERAGDSFTWMSIYRGCIAYLCTHGFRLKTDSTSATHIGCYVKSCDDTGFDIDNCAYTPLIGCGVDNTPKPYVFNTANGVSLVSCGAEFNDGRTYSGFIWLRGTGYVNLQILGGKWLIGGGSTCAHFIYSTFAGTELAEISISGLGSKANLNLTGNLVNARADVYLSDDCHLGASYTFQASGGGMLTYRGKTSGVRRAIKQSPVANAGSTSAITGNNYCRVQRVVDISTLGTNVLYVEVPAQLATSVTRGTIRVTPLGPSEANGEASSTFGTTGSFAGHYYNNVGAGILLKRNNTLGNNNQSFVIDKTKWTGKVIVDVEIEGLTDTEDTMVTITVGAAQWP